MEQSESIQEKLQDFAHYFVRKVDSKLASCLAILEEREVPSSSSTAGSVIAGVTSAVPKIGKGIAKVVEKGDSFVVKKLDKDQAMVLSPLVYLQRSNKDEFRRTLVRAAYEVFSCFEAQFLQLSCNGGTIRAMQKLGYDAARRFLAYALEVKLDRVGVDDVIKGVVWDSPSFLGDLGLVRAGRAVKDVEERSWNVDKIYRKVGVRVTETGMCYRNERTNSAKYGHRLKFAHESVEEFEEQWQVDQVDYSYNNLTSLANFDADYEGLLEFMARQNSVEFDEYDRRVKHELLMKDLEDKHVEAMEDRADKHEEASKHRVDLHEDLKTLADGHHKEVTQMLVKIAEKQDLLVPEMVVPPPPYELVEKIVVEKLEEKIPEEPVPVLKRLEREVKEELRKIDPTMHPEFRKLKKKWGF